MKLKKELRKIWKNAKERKQEERNEEENELIEEFIKQKLITNAELGNRGAVFSLYDEEIGKDNAIYLNIFDFERFAKKNHLKIKYMDKELQTETNKEFAEKVIIKF